MPTVIADDDHIEPMLYDYAALVRNGVVHSRSELQRLVRHEGFPAPIKSGASAQSGVRYHGASVRAWIRQRALAANFLPKQQQPESLAKSPKRH